MYILFLLPLILLLAFSTIVLLIKRWWRTAIITFLTALFINYYTQSIPINFSSKSENKSQKNIRILSYNIGLHNKELSQKDGLESFISFLKVQDADILVLPESRIWKKKELREALECLYPYNIATAFPNKEIYIETFIYSKFSLNNVQQIGKDYSYMTNIQIDNDSVKLIACHLSSNQNNSKLNGGEGLIENIKNGYRSRFEETNNIYNAVKDWNGPILLCGDLNDLSGSSTLKNLQKNLLLSDAWWQGGCGYGATFNSKGLYLRLDHILYSSHFKLQFVDISNINFSDHYPIVADFTIE